MTNPLRPIALGLLLLTPAAASASEAERLAGLSKSKFLAEYEEGLLAMMDAQEELFVRFDPEMAEKALNMGPVTDAERAAASCMWDLMDGQDNLEAFAQQVLIGARMAALVEERPDLDIVDFFTKAEIVEQTVQSVPDEILPAMSECGSMQASAHRIDNSPEIFGAIGAEAQARGYLD